MSFPDLSGLANDLVATGIVMQVGAPISTIGTIISIASPNVQNYQVSNAGGVSATIKATPGNYYGAVLTSVIGVGTLLIINAGAANATGSILGYLSVPTTAVSNGILGGLSTPYSTLMATLIGTLQANVYYT